MAHLVPYINFVDKSQEAVAFYTAVFGGEAEVQADAGRIVHLEFKAGDIHFMGGDHAVDEAGLTASKGYSLVLTCDSEAQLRDFYARLADSGQEIFAPMDSGWGATIAHCTDRFGVSWMLNYDKPEEAHNEQ
ncbi:MAG TPA: VOC family protein [Candidatus Saccharimonadales bacterium]|nr:VOC family protein [Candidatus Saccharimonadales bacterium]